MFLLFLIITIFALSVTIYLVINIEDNDGVGVLVIQTMIIILSIFGSVISCDSKNEINTKPTIQNKDRAIIKDSLLILDTNDSIKVFNIKNGYR